MGADGSKWWDQDSSGNERTIGPLEHELTMHLERAHMLAERAKRSNQTAQHEIDRCSQIAEEIVVEVRRNSRR
jgi:hypothetical protein